MINFFRKIRRKMAYDNKPLKYIRYGIGEIVLVVIGIFIALNLNNQNEQRKKELKVEAIFEDILLELSSDIDKTTELMRFFVTRDSTIYLVLNDSLTFEDYEQNKIPYLFNLTTFYPKINLTQDAYNILIQNMDAIPLQYKSVLSDLSILYNQRKKLVELSADNALSFITDNVNIRMRNYSWFSPRDSSDMKSRIEFHLENFRYRNEVFSFFHYGIGNHLGHAIFYRLQAVDCYQQISTLLNKTTIDDSFVFDQDVANIIVGEWESQQTPDFRRTFYMDDNRCFAKNAADSIMNQYFSISKTKMVNISRTFYTIVKEGDEYILKTNKDSFRRVEK